MRTKFQTFSWCIRVIVVPDKVQTAGDKKCVCFSTGCLEGTSRFPLSSIDQYLKEQGSTQAYYIGEHGGPSTAQEALVLIFPAFEEQVCTIYVWSKETVFEHPPSGTAQTVSYHIHEYQVNREMFTAKDTMEGNYQQAAEFLQDVINAWRE